MNIGPGPVPPQDIHTSLIDALHGAMTHPGFGADQKAEYSGILQTLMRRQAQNHAQARPAAGPGGPVVEPGQPTSDAQTSALLQALFPPRQAAGPATTGYDVGGSLVQPPVPVAARPVFHAPVLQGPVSILAALGAGLDHPGFGGGLY